jgi:hypothetical protein
MKTKAEVREEIVKILRCEIPECNHGWNCTHVNQKTCVDCQADSILKWLVIIDEEAELPKPDINNQDIHSADHAYYFKKGQQSLIKANYKKVVEDK